MSELRAVLFQPSCQSGGCRRLIAGSRHQQTVRKPPNLIPSENDVIQEDTQKAAGSVRDPPGRWHYETPRARLVSHQLHHLSIGKDLWTDRIDLDTVMSARLFDGKLSQVLHKHRLDTVAARAGQHHHGELSKRPRYVVQEYVPSAIQEGWAENGVRETEPAQRLFKLSLTTEVWQGRIRIGVRDAYVNDTPDPGGPGRVEEYARFLNTALVGAVAVADTNPVGIEECVGARQGLSKQVRAIKVERMSGDPIPERAGTLRVSGYRLDRVPFFEKESGDVPSGLSGRSSYGVCE